MILNFDNCGGIGPAANGQRQNRIETFVETSAHELNPTHGVGEYIGHVLEAGLFIYFPAKFVFALLVLAGPTPPELGNLAALK